MSLTKMCLDLFSTIENRKRGMLSLACKYLHIFVGFVTRERSLLLSLIEVKCK